MAKALPFLADCLLSGAKASGNLLAAPGSPVVSPLAVANEAIGSPLADHWNTVSCLMRCFWALKINYLDGQDARVELMRRRFQAAAFSADRGLDPAALFAPPNAASGGGELPVDPATGFRLVSFDAFRVAVRSRAKLSAGLISDEELHRDIFQAQLNGDGAIDGHCTWQDFSRWLKREQSRTRSYARVKKQHTEHSSSGAPATPRGVLAAVPVPSAAETTAVGDA
eukprot:SAG22_NODE_334_length_12094_cov_9.446019_5_plen_225_part_00